MTVGLLVAPVALQAGRSLGSSHGRNLWQCDSAYEVQVHIVNDEVSGDRSAEIPGKLMHVTKTDTESEGPSRPHEKPRLRANVQEGENRRLRP